MSYSLIDLFTAYAAALDAAAKADPIKCPPIDKRAQIIAAKMIVAIHSDAHKNGRADYWRDLPALRVAARTVGIKSMGELRAFCAAQPAELPAQIVKMSAIPMFRSHSGDLGDERPIGQRTR